MIIYGAGGHARVIISIARALNIQVAGIFDDNPFLYELNGIPIQLYSPDHLHNHPLVVAIGDNQTREKVTGLVSHPFAYIIHPSAVVDQTVAIGPGTTVMQRAVIQTDCCIGNHVIVNSGALVDHDCLIEDFVHIAPGAVLCGAVRVGKSTLIGAGSIVTPGISIGKNCLIAAGSVLTHSIEDNCVVRGNPARIISVGEPLAAGITQKTGKV